MLNVKTLGLIPEIVDYTSGNNSTSNSVPSYMSQSDIELGKKALTHFHNRALGYEDYPFSSVEALAAHYTKNSDILFDGIGGAIREMGEFLTDKKVEDAMYAIADSGSGKIPQNMTTFFTKLGQVASNPSIAETISYVTAQSLSDIGVGLEELGESTGTALSQANYLWKYLPWIGLGLGVVFILTYAKGLGSGHGKIAEKVLR